MRCKYMDICPSASGWCEHRQADLECASFLHTAYDFAKGNFEEMLKEAKDCMNQMNNINLILKSILEEEK